MRLIPALFIAAGLAVTPAIAQDATAPLAVPAAADIGPNVDRDFWCATAFGLTSYLAGQAGDQATAAGDTNKMQTLFAAIVALMKTGNFQEAQFTAMNGVYTAKVMNPFTPADEGYPRETCDTAFTEAEASVAAAMAAEAAAGPVDPAAPAPTDPAAPGTAPADPAAPAAPAQ